jgi:two-component system, NarL family, response regulator LiaR
MPKAIRVALVNDYEIVVEGLRALLRPYEPELSVVEIDLKTKPRRTVDVSLLDTYGEIQEVTERVRELAADPTNGAVVVFSFSDHPAAVRAVLRSGAQGFISKAVAATQIVDGIRGAARGQKVVLTHRTQRALIPPGVNWPGKDRGLTERESELLALLPTGMTNRELAAHLYLSENTIKTQLRALFAKLEVRNRVQASMLARRGMLGDQRARSQEG